MALVYSVCQTILIMTGLVKPRGIPGRLAVPLRRLNYGALHAEVSSGIDPAGKSDGFTDIRGSELAACCGSFFIVHETF